jgi:hypothetical protein
LRQMISHFICREELINLEGVIVKDLGVLLPARQQDHLMVIFSSSDLELVDQVSVNSLLIFKPYNGGMNYLGLGAALR